MSPGPRESPSLAPWPLTESHRGSVGRPESEATLRDAQLGGPGTVRKVAGALASDLGANSVVFSRRGSIKSITPGQGPL